MLARERGEGQDLGLGGVHQRTELGKPGGELVAGLVPGRLDVLGGGLGEDHPECRGHVVGLALGHVGEQVAREVDVMPTSA